VGRSELHLGRFGHPKLATWAVFDIRVGRFGFGPFWSFSALTVTHCKGRRQKLFKVCTPTIVKQSTQALARTEREGRAADNGPGLARTVPMSHRDEPNTTQYQEFHARSKTFMKLSPPNRAILKLNQCKETEKKR